MHSGCASFLSSFGPSNTSPEAITIQLIPQNAGPKIVLFHPDYTVGSGISPDLLTLD
ncbi:putative secreted protein [Thalassobium sp. R2A62]|nr:putative secreted protein [Thalassobium sp. R2A62]